MTDISGVPAFGGGGFVARQAPDTLEPVVREAAEPATTNGSAAQSQGETLLGQNGTYNQSNHDSSDADQKRRDAVRDETVLTGPTPAFQASILDFERDLRNVIARIEAKRTQQADEAAIAPRAVEMSIPAAQNAEATETGQIPPVTPLASTEAMEPPAEQPALPVAQMVTAPAEPVDPEAVHSGPAATQNTPYDPQS
ncbi:hypothetical protein [Celeribacter sp.]|uniref:hypothetical protein n=1 Tax=Celeribacter sp. TaxID=1890673 RepID=UPI003A8F05A2